MYGYRDSPQKRLRWNGAYAAETGKGSAAQSHPNFRGLEIPSRKMKGRSGQSTALWTPFINLGFEDYNLLGSPDLSGVFETCEGCFQLT
jgi:hypothetical protein